MCDVKSPGGSRVLGLDETAKDKNAFGAQQGSATGYAEVGYEQNPMLVAAYNRRQELGRQKFLIEHRLQVVNVIIDAFGG